MKIDDHYWTVIGVDPSSHVLAAVLLDGGPTRYQLRTLPDDKVYACTQADRWLYALVRREQGNGPVPTPVYVFIESPVLGRQGGPGATLPQAMVFGAAVAGATRAGAQYVEPTHHASWKKTVIGNGNASKAMIQIHVRQEWRADYRAFTDKSKYLGDLCDARAIAEYGEWFVDHHELI
jgi:Holliday junction resolvasome RuvABC endonuclease subunit